MNELASQFVANHHRVGGITALIFDLDGVLVSSRGLHETAFLEAVCASGVYVDHVFHAEHLDGLPTREKLARLNVPADQHDVIYEHKRRLTVERADQHLSWNEGTHDLMADLKSRGYRVGIASNASGYFCRRAVELLGVGDLLDCLLTNEDVRRPKPDPEMYVRAMECLGSAPGQTLVFEDATFGLASAFAAGARVCYVSDPSLLTRNRINCYLQAYGAVTQEVRSD